jgi:Sugar-transfer associated ATP-grasp
MASIIRRAFSPYPFYERLRYVRKIKQLKREYPAAFQTKLEPSVQREIISYWRSFGVRVNLDWHRGYISICGGENVHRYIPEDIYYAYIERAFSRHELADPYADKNSYDRIFPGVPGPISLLRRINGRFYSRDYRVLTLKQANDLISEHQGDLIVKPSIDSGDGKNVRKLTIDHGKLAYGEESTDFEKLTQSYGLDFLVQHVFQQHPAMAEFHPSSVNTVRFYTLRLDDEIKVISAVFRAGNMGRCVDNRGIPCGINAEGKLNDHANTKYFTKHEFHPVTGKAFRGFVIPGWQAACEFVKQLHEQLLYFDSVSWDITINPDSQPCLMEVNLTFQEINFHQVNNGPLYGDLTDEVLTRVFKRVNPGGFTRYPLRKTSEK